MKIAWLNPVMVMSASSCPQLNKYMKAELDDNISECLRIFPLLF